MMRGHGSESCSHSRHDFAESDVYCTVCGKILFTSCYSSPYDVAKDFFAFRMSLPKLSRRIEDVKFT